MAATKLVLIVVLFILPHLHCEDSSSQLKQVIHSLQNLIAFYKENYRDLNLDGLFGLRALEGHLQLILSENRNGSHSHLSEDVVSDLRSMATDSTMISNQALEFVKRDDEGYFNSMSYVVGQPWNILHKHRMLDPELRWKPSIYKSTKQFKISESISDKCMSELTGSTRHDGKSCMISKECLDIMTMKGLTEYGITHQILWTMLGEKTNCLHELDSLLGSAKGTSASAMQKEFCTNNFFEMAAVVHVYMQGKIKHEYQDLFLEQQFVCPSLGFYEFLKKEYLDQILSWQFPSGCFGDPKNNVNPVLHDKHIIEMNGPLDMQPQNNSANLQRNPATPGPKMNNRLPQIPLHNMNTSNINSYRNISKRPNSQPVNNNSVKSDISLKQKSASAIRQAVHINKAKPAFLPNINKQSNVVSNQIGHVNAPNSKDQFAMRANNIGKSKLLKVLQSDTGAVNANVIKPKDMFKPMVNMVGGRQLKSVSENSAYIGRKLLAEKEMRNGCMSHTTAVATGALVMYLRYLIDPGPLDFYGSHHILQETSRSLLGQDVENEQPQGGDSRKVKQEEFIPVKDPSINLNPDPADDGINASEVVEDDEDEEEDDEYDDVDENDDDPEYDNDENKDEVIYPDAETPDNKKLAEKKVIHFNPGLQEIEMKKNLYEGGDEIDYPDHDKKNNPNDADYNTYYEEGDEVKYKSKQEFNLNADDNNNDVNNINDNKIDRDIDINNNPDIDSNIQNNNNIMNNNNVESERDILAKMANANPGTMKEATLPSMRTLFIFFAVCLLMILIFMFRFIKKRRVHIRYHPRDFLRL